MIRKEDRIVMRAIALAYKPLLKPEEASIFLDLSTDQLRLRALEFGIQKTHQGYYKREDLLTMAGANTETRIQVMVDDLDKKARKLKDNYGNNF